MNTLEWWLKNHPEIKPVDAMNVLQNHGTISDNAVNVEDVSESDCLRATMFLEQYLQLEQKAKKGIQTK